MLRLYFIKMMLARNNQPCCLVYIFKAGLFSLIPRLASGRFIQRLLVQLHGFVTPGRISAGCPHCLRRFFHARAVTGQESHYPHWRSSPYQGPPDTDRLLFSLLADWPLMAQHLSRLLLIALPMGSCWMDGYSFFKIQ